MSSVTLETLVESVAASTRTCQTVRCLLHELAQGSDSADETVLGLDRDTQSLRTAHQSLSSTLAKIQELTEWTESSRDKDMWSTVHGTVTDCRRQLRALIKILEEVRGSEGHEGWMPSTMRAFRLGVSRDELINYSAELQHFDADLQISLAMVNLHISNEVASRTDSWSGKLLTLVHELQSTLNEKAAPLKRKDLDSLTRQRLKSTAKRLLNSTGDVKTARRKSSHRRTMYDFRRLSSQTDAGLSNRQSVYIWIEKLMEADLPSEDAMPDLTALTSQTFLKEGDEDGDGRHDDRQQAIQRSISPGAERTHEVQANVLGRRGSHIPAERDKRQDDTEFNDQGEDIEHVEAAVHNEDGKTHDALENDHGRPSASQESPANNDDERNGCYQDLSTNAIRSEEDDYREDINADLMLALSKAGKEHFENSDAVQATENLSLALDYAKQLSARKYSQHDLTEQRLILATIHLQERGLDRAEEHLRALAEESIMTEENAPLICEALYKLARICFLKQEHEDALAFCQRCIHSLGKTLGKDSEPFHKAVQLLVLIYRAKGQGVEANAMLRSLPEHLAEETEPPSATTCRTPSTSTRTSTTGSSFQSKRSLSIRRGQATSSDHSQSPDLFSETGFSDELSRLKTATSQNTTEHTRQDSVNRETDPAAMLSAAGFTGNFDSAKAMTWAIAGNHIGVVQHLLDGYQVTRPKKSRFSRSRGEPEGGGTRAASVNGEAVSSHFGVRRTPIPLLLAIEYSRVAIARLLLARGASVMVQDRRGRPALRAAAEGGQLDIVRLLLDRGAPLEAATGGPPPLPPPELPARSASRASRDAPRPGSRASREPPPPRPASRASRPGTAASRPGTATSSTRRHGGFGSGYGAVSVREFGALHGAVAHGHEAVAAELLAAGARPEARDPHGSTALKVACARGHAACAQLLLRHHAGGSTNGSGSSSGSGSGGGSGGSRLVDTGDDAGWTPLMAAAHGGHEACARLLLRAGAALDARNRGGQSALAVAAECGREGVAKALLNAGARAEAADAAGWTPLLSAANRGHERILVLLLAAGAHINAQSHRGSTALDRAEHWGNKRLMEFLRKGGAVHGSQTNEPVKITPYTGYTI